MIVKGKARQYIVLALEQYLRFLEDVEAYVADENTKADAANDVGFVGALLSELGEDVY